MSGQDHAKGSDKINFVELLTVDLDGRPKGMTVPIQPVDDVGELIGGASKIPGCGVDGSSLAGMATIEQSDLRLVPDTETVRELPGATPRRAVVMADVYQRGPDGQLQPYSIAPRSVLRRLVQILKERGMRLRVKLEPEFYYLASDGCPLDRATYADLFPYNRGADLLLETALDLRAVGIEARWIHSEVGHGQQEIELDFTDIDRAADNILLFKILVRRRAAKHGVDVTFMPKPFPDQPGSGLHCHLQLWKGNQNIMGAPGGTLSKQGLHFLAGLLEHAPAISAIANPSINSYKRLVPGFEAPVYIAWGPRNRSALLRQPLFTSPQNAAVEFRSPDPLANPYLLLACLAAAGLDGLDRQLKPPEPVQDNLFTMSRQEREQRRIGELPRTLQEALQALQEDKLLQQVLGEELIRTYINLRAADWHTYIHTCVTDWERTRYLHL